MMTSDQFFGLVKDNPHDHIRCALNPADQDSLNSATGGNLLERRTQDVLTIIENKSKVRNSQNKSIVSQVKSSDANSSSSEIAKLTHALNQQTSAVTTAMIAILKQFQANPPPAFVKAVKEICVTCGGAHPYYQCLAANGNTFSELQDNIQGYVLAAKVNYNQELKVITTRSGIVLDGPFVPIPPPFINPEQDERVEETLTDQDLAEDPLHPNIPYPSRMHKQKQQEKDDVQINKFWQMFKQLHINITLIDALILIPKYQKMLKALLSNKEKLLELANTPLNENCSAVILKKLPEKLGDPGKFLIPCGFSELKCKTLADLGASINLIPLSVLKKLGLPELISTRMTFELANRAICTPTGIARDVFVSVGKFTFPADFFIVDYESDPRMILHDSDERLTLKMRHDTSSYSNQPKKESINMINISNDSIEGFLEKLFATNHQSGNPTFSSHPNLTSPKVKDDIFDPEGGNVLIEKLLDIDSTKDPDEKLLNINLLIAKIKSLNDNPTPDHVLKPLSPSPIPVEDSDSFLEKSDTSLSYLDNSLPEFKILAIIPKRRIVAIPPLMLITLFPKPRVHVPNVLTTHHTLMLDLDFIPSDNSLPESEIFFFDIEEKNSGSTTIHADISLSDLECFNFKREPEPGE
nr:reverse transcriptase domain-containing protein [Tanacetum cinerariifolium]